MRWWHALTWIPIILAGLGCAYHLFAALAVRRFFHHKSEPYPTPEAVSLLKPLYGYEPRLVDNLASFLVQDYQAPVQMVCGVNSLDDPALQELATLRRAHPSADITLTDAEHLLPTRNGKVRNLIAMTQAAKHNILVLSDSDMAVTSDYLSRVGTALDHLGVGAVSCLYVGRGDAGFWSVLGAAMIDGQSLPNMVVGLVSGMAQPCMGSTIALRRQTLDAIGGFARFADVLADDHAIGEAVTAQGLTVSVPPMLVTHAGTEANFTELWRHHLRWAVTIRGIARAGHLGSIIVHALPWALIASAFHPDIGATLVLAALISRSLVATEVARAARRLVAHKPPPFWLLPLVDIFGFVIFLASLFARRIDWRGAKLTIEPKGRIALPLSKQ